MRSRRSASDIFSAQFVNKNYFGLINLLPQHPEGFGALLDSEVQKISAPVCADESKQQSRRIAFADEIPEQAPSEEQDDDEPLMVVFDEAMGLLSYVDKEVDSECCPLKCIQRALEACGMIGLFVADNADIDISADRGSRMKEKPAPVVTVVRHDLFSDHLFFYGRPLWKASFVRKCHGDMNLLINMVTNKLAHRHEPVAANLIALFCMRFGFVPVSHLCSSFVSDFLAVMTELETDESGFRVAKCRWLSEPVMAEVSACLTMGGVEGSKHYGLHQVMKSIKHAVVYEKTIHPGADDTVEVILAGALLGYTLDILKARQCGGLYDANRRELTMSCGIALGAFLAALGITQLPSGIDGYLISFTHMVYLDFRTDIDTCFLAIARRIGYYVSSGAASVNIVLVACKIVNKGTVLFIPVRVHVENLTGKLSKDKTERLLQNMSPARRCQPVLEDEHCELEIGIVLSMGCRGADEVEPLIMPSESGREYVGYMLDIHGAQHFKALQDRETVKHAPLGHEKVLWCIADIAEHHAHADVHDCFDEGFRKHSESMSCPVSCTAAAVC